MDAGTQGLQRDKEGEVGEGGVLVEDYIISNKEEVLAQA